MNKTRISQILNQLMTEKKIRTTELARRVSLPQPTIHRIVTGACEHPHHSSLKPIANFFSISIDQLKGLDPIPWFDRAMKIPLLEWERILDWPVTQKEVHSQLILTDANVGFHAYGLTVQDASMEPVFPKNTILIVDPDKQAKDRSYVIAKLANLQEPVFRQLLIDAHDKYLKPLSPSFDQCEMICLNNNDKILSVVVQAKRDYED